MAKNSKIEWCDHTFNPWVGCTKVSPACDNCYAEKWAKRSGMVTWGSGQARRRTSPRNWQQPLAWDRQARAAGVRHRVFCASLADVFDNAVPSSWRSDLFELIDSTPYLDWLLLTKRIGNAEVMINDACSDVMRSWREPWDNVWLGATICNQDEADRDIPKLLDTSAHKRFLSIEPMLGGIDLINIKHPKGYGCSPCTGCANDVFIDALKGTTHCKMGCDGPYMQGIDWVIVGGESGGRARPINPDWVRSLRDQCDETGTAFFFKQWGRRGAGRVLDGQVWDQTP